MHIADRFAAAAELRAYIDLVEQNADLWRFGARKARVDEALVERVAAVGGTWRFLALAEDWCMDAFNTLPTVARLAELAPNVELRVLGRDANPDLMDAHLSGTARAIPVVIVYDAAWREVGWWGSRPAPLQALVASEWQGLAKDEVALRKRQWYAQDRGRSVGAELVALVERAAADAQGAGGAHANGRPPEREAARS